MKISKIIFIGGNRYKEDGPALSFIEICKKNNIQVDILVDKERIDYPTKTMGIFKEYLNENNINYHVISEISTKIIKKLLEKNTIIVTVNCRWIIKEEIIQLLNKNIYNYHNSSLPGQRGAACHSWRLMQGINDSHLTIHKLTSKLDKGEIIINKRIKFPKSCTTLESSYKHIEKNEKDIFKKFIFLKKLVGKKQNEEKSYYWPRLDTLKHGLIDWSWSAKDIKLFCSSFDKPFKGASTYLNKKRVFFSGVKVVDTKIYFHPYQAGLVYRISDEYFYVASINGGLKIKEIKPENADKSFKVKLGQRFITPIEKLYSAKIDKPGY